VFFAYDASPKQVSTITPGTAIQHDPDEDDTIEITGTVQKEGIYGTTVGLSQ